MNDLQMTQLYAARLEAIRRHDWAEVERINTQITQAERESQALIDQLWPGVKVAHE